MPIYVTPADALTANAIFDVGSNQVFDNGANATFAKAGQPPELISTVYLGALPIPKVYAGADIVHEAGNTFTLSSQIDVNLETFLAGETVDTALPVIVIVPSGAIIGSSAKGITSLVSGDLSIYTAGVTLNVVGEIQGFAESNAFENTSPMNLHNTGAIRAGGGTGGVGGKGAQGDDADSPASYRVSTSGGVVDYGWAEISSLQHRWANVNKGTGSNNIFNNPNDGYMYFRKVQDTIIANYDSIGRGLYYLGVGGTGGAGGVGQGYQQNWTEGALGTEGTNRSGNGGKGGDGGDWGADGAVGNQGGTGLYYSATSAGNVRAGAVGIAGTPAGITIIATAALNYSGDGIVNGSSEGSISPVVTISRAAPGECEYQYPETECSSQTAFISTNGYFTNPPDTYDWSAVGATIISGQGTPTIIVETTGGVDVPFTVTLNAEDSSSGDSASVTGNFTDLRNLNQSVDYNGTPITVPNLTLGSAMGEIDCSGSFNGEVSFYSLSGTWPVGIAVDENGILSGIPNSAGSFTGTVDATGSINTANSNSISFDVEDVFVENILLNVPLEDVAVPVDQTAPWPFNRDNDFLLCTKFVVPDTTGNTSPVFACRYSWQNIARYIGIQVQTDNSVRVIYEDGTGAVATTVAQAPGGTLEVKVLKSSTRGIIVWLDDAKQTSEHPTKTAPLDTILQTEVQIGALDGADYLNTQMFCMSVYGVEPTVTDTQIESIVLCENSTTPPVGVPSYLDDYDATTAPIPPEIVADWSSHKHPKTHFIEGSMDRMANVNDFMKYMFVNSMATELGTMDKLRISGHQFLSKGLNPCQENEWKQGGWPDLIPAGYKCSQGWAAPFIGLTASAGDYVDVTLQGVPHPKGSCFGGMPAQWFVLRKGTTIQSGMNNTDSLTSVPVADNSNFDLGDYAIIRPDLNTWAGAELVKIEAKTTGSLSLTRGYLSPKQSFNSGAYIAQVHQSDNSDGRYFTYNLSTQCPVDGNGKQFNVYVAEWHNAGTPPNMNKTIGGNEFPNLSYIGIMYDVDRDYLFGTANPTGADVDNDGNVDAGLGPNGEEWWIDGWNVYYAKTRELNPDKVQVGGTIYAAGVSANGQNGTQMESMFTGFGSYSYKELSAHMSDYAFREHRMKVGPPINTTLFKQDTASYFNVGNIPAGDRLDSPWRMSMCAILMEEGYVMHQARHDSGGDCWYDDFAVNIDPLYTALPYGKSADRKNVADCAATIGWLGDALESRRRVFNSNEFDVSQDLLNANPTDGIAGWTNNNNTISYVGGELHATAMTSYGRSKTAAGVFSPNINMTGGEYAVCFTMRSSKVRRVKVELGSHKPISILCDTADRKYVMTFAPGTVNAPIRFYLGEQNTEFWLKEVYVFKGTADVFVRKFTNGIVVANLTPSSVTVDLDVPYQRILGVNNAGQPQNPLNDGTAIPGSTVIVDPYDGLILVKQQ